MPTYQYVCTDCGEPLEVVQSFSDDALTECPACQGRLRKVFSAVGVVFKGSGFYRTDSRSNGSSATTTASTSSNDSSSSTSESGGSSSSSTKDAGASKDSGSSNGSGSSDSKPKAPASTGAA